MLLAFGGVAGGLSIYIYICIVLNMKFKQNVVYKQMLLWIQMYYIVYTI